MTELNLNANWLINSIRSSVERVQKFDSVHKDRLGKLEETDCLSKLEKMLRDKDVSRAA